jgi:hypothetical protein
MTNMTAKELVALLGGLSMEIAYYPGPPGVALTIKAQDFPALVADPLGFAARRLGLTREQFIEWRNSDWVLQCAALTKLRRRCRNLVIHPWDYCSAAEWLALQGEYCPLHGGPTREERELRHRRTH